MPVMPTDTGSTGVEKLNSRKSSCPKLSVASPTPSGQLPMSQTPRPAPFCFTDACTKVPALVSRQPVTVSVTPPFDCT